MTSKKSLALKKLIILELSFLILQTGCGVKDQTFNESQNEKLSRSGELVGGAITKEILIKGHKTSDSKVVSGAIKSASIVNSPYKSANYGFIKSINSEEKFNKMMVNDKYNSLFKSEYFIEATGQALKLTTGLAGPMAIPFGLGIDIATKSLSGFAKNKRENEYAAALSAINLKRDRDILLYSISSSREISQYIMNDLHAGLSAASIKDKLISYKQNLANDTNITVDKAELLINNLNEDLIINLAFGLKNDLYVFDNDVKKIAKNIQNQNEIIENMSKTMSEFVKYQTTAIKEIKQNFSSDDLALVANTIFGSNYKNALNTPKENEIAFFKKYPEKLNEYQELKRSGKLEKLIYIDRVQSKANEALVHLQATAIIANNLNLDPKITEVISTGEKVASITSNVAALLITPSPLSALSALGAISSLFSKPKPDPFMQNVFKNFEEIKKTLAEIRNDLVKIQAKLDIIDNNIDYVINQNNKVAKLLMATSRFAGSSCSVIANLTKETIAKGLDYQKLAENYNQDEFQNKRALSNCLNYLDEVFNSPLEDEKAIFFETYIKSQYSDESEKFNSKNKLQFIYESVIDHYTDLNELLYSKDKFLSLDAVFFHSKNLLENSFWFDLTSYDSNLDKYNLVEFSEIRKNAKKNQVSQRLLKKSLALIELSITQQMLVDGFIDNTSLIKTVYSSDFKNINCEKINFEHKSCVPLLNKNFAENTIRSLIKHLTLKNYFESWEQIASNNPDHLNKFLTNTNLKVVWIGKNASALFKGEVLAENPNFKDGAYVKIGANDLFIPLPRASVSKSVSDRVSLLLELRDLVKNEIIERNTDKILDQDELLAFNQKKYEQVLGRK